MHASLQALGPAATGLSIVLASSAFAQSPPAVKDWLQYNYDNRGWRYNPAETLLSPETVPQLVERWRFPSAESDDVIGPVHATPVVANGFVYFGTARPGVFYKLTPRGHVAWAFEIPASPVGYEVGDEAAQASTESSLLSWVVGNSALVTDQSVFFGTGDGQIFCLDRYDGTERWSVNTRMAPFPGHHLVNSFWSTPIIADGKLIMAGGAFEQALAAFDPNYECCTGRGLVAAFEPSSGELIWKYDLGPEPTRYPEPIEIDYGQVCWSSEFILALLALEVPPSRGVPMAPAPQLGGVQRRGKLPELDSKRQPSG